MSEFDKLTDAEYEALLANMKANSQTLRQGPGPQEGLARRTIAETPSARTQAPEAPTLIGRVNGYQAARTRAELLENLPQNSNYEWFLDIVQNRRHPDNCRIIWDGEQPLIQFVVQFQKNDKEDSATVSKRAWRYFRRYSTYEQKIVRFELVYSDKGRLKHALVSVRPEAAGLVRFGTTRLRELAEDPKD
jgi:hypothetical protein